MHLRSFSFAALTLLAVLLSFVVGCDNAASTPPVSNPLPTISSLAPAGVTAGSAAFTLTVNGTNFVSTSAVRWNGSNRTTTFVSATQLTAAITAADITAPATVSVTVVNPAPGGGTATAMSFITGNPVPTVTSLSPAGASVGGTAFTLNVNGAGFVSSATVQWGGANRTTTFVSATRLTADIPQSDLAAEGNPNVSVVNPAPNGGPSNSVGFFVQPGSGVVALVSVATDGTQGDADSADASVSADGRYVAFSSFATNLVAGDANNFQDVFLRDTCFGAPAGCTPSTILVSVDNNGTQGDATSHFPSISTDGRFVMFTSGATTFTAVNTILSTKGTGRVEANKSAATAARDLAAPGGGGATDAILAIVALGTTDVYVRDTCNGAPAGCTASTTLLSVSTGGTAGNGNSATSAQPTQAIAAGGRLFLFGSAATNLVATDTNGNSDVFIRDTCFGAPAGCTPSTTLISAATDGTQGNAFSGFPRMSPDGRYVGFQSTATNLVAGDTNVKQDDFVRDTCFSAPAGCTPSTVRVSLADDGSESNDVSYTPSLAAGGRYVIFESPATNLVTIVDPGPLNSDVFLRDTCTGAAGCTPSTIRVSLATDGTPADGPAEVPSVSQDGRFIAIPALASNLISADSNGAWDVFVRDTCIGAPPGCTPTTVRVNVAADGSEANGETNDFFDFAEGGFAGMSTDGQFVGITSDATNLVSGDANAHRDVFLTRSGYPITEDFPVAAVTSVSPSSAAAGSGSLTVTVTGSNFVPASVARWNGSNRATFYVSSTELLVRVEASDLAGAGAASITVFNRLPGGGTSSAATFTITP